jgi:hypothetical protein
MISEVGSNPTSKPSTQSGYSTQFSRVVNPGLPEGGKSRHGAGAAARLSVYRARKQLCDYIAKLVDSRPGKMNRASIPASGITGNYHERLIVY